jgi:hypothetical protein
MDIDEITYQIHGSIFEVNSVLDHGFLEKVYEICTLMLATPVKCTLASIKYATL